MLIGLEKENLIFNKDYSPRNFKVSELPGNITLDFSDNQVEFVSKPHDSITSLFKEMFDMINNPIFTDVMIWPLSQPGINNYTPSIVGCEDDIDIQYRKELLNKYSPNLMNMSGIHFNYSTEVPAGKSDREYYFDLMKKLYVFGPVLQQFVSYSPVYEQQIMDEGLSNVGVNRGYKDSMSLRNSQNYGYYNEQDIMLDFTSLEKFEQSKSKKIEEGTLINEKEIYSKIRLKQTNSGSSYIELRFIDINPFHKIGITPDMVEFITMFIEFIESSSLEDFNYAECLSNFELIATTGLNRSQYIKIGSYNGTIKSVTNEILNDMKIKCNNPNIVTDIQSSYLNKTSDLYKLLDYVVNKNMSIQTFGKKYAFTKKQFVPNEQLFGLELSTVILIEEALKSGIEVNVLDVPSNAIELVSGNKSEIVFQATKTNLDKYANILVMENKLTTKYVLNKNMIKVPSGIALTKDMRVNSSDIKSKKIVVKPVDTNFGIGISIINNVQSEIDKAVNLAFKHSDQVIIEKYVAGTEYRFLVIDGKLISVVCRVPANVTGDGVHTISELVDLKNNDHLRGQGYKTPLEIIKLGDFECDFIAKSGLNKDSIPKIGETIYLRSNSNISTGGDSIEVMDIIPFKFKEIAIKAAEALDVVICGVDIIIDDEFSDYAIIEANFNPAIQMHTYPMIGTGRNVAKEIISALFK